MGSIASPNRKKIMSRKNIIGMDVQSLSVTFSLRSGGTRTYYYELEDFAAIYGGDDPKDYAGSETPNTDADNAARIAEIIATLLE